MHWKNQIKLVQKTQSPFKAPGLRGAIHSTSLRPHFPTPNPQYKFFHGRKETKIRKYACQKPLKANSKLWNKLKTFLLGEVLRAVRVMCVKSWRSVFESWPDQRFKSFNIMMMAMIFNNLSFVLFICDNIESKLCQFQLTVGSLIFRVGLADVIDLWASDDDDELWSNFEYGNDLWLSDHDIDPLQLWW